MILVTGAAGFIGFHLCKRLIELGESVVGFDNINNYYDPELKRARLNELEKLKKQIKGSYFFIKGDLKDNALVEKLFLDHEPQYVVNLAAQAGVRYSIENPSSYINSNLIGFFNILESSKNHKIKHLLYASSSSVYGGNQKMPFSEDDSVDHPVSLYGASKKCNELLAHTYSHVYNLPSTGLRFFTVYGPWGRPDMALFIFTKAIFEDQPIRLFNKGEMLRDFTYIDDIINSMVLLLKKEAKGDKNFNPKKPNPSTSWAPHRVFNIGNSNPIPLMSFVSTIEKITNKTAKKSFSPMHIGDVPRTFADTSKLQEYINYKPNTPIDIGIKNFIEWYQKYYKK